MERDYLEWINRAYEKLCKDPSLSKLEMKVHDGKIAVYRVRNVIRIDINREETKC